MVTRSVLKIACCVLVCEALFVSCKSNVNDDITGQNTYNGEVSDFGTGTRTKRESQNYVSSASRPNFTDIASKIKVVIDKMQPDEDEVAEFENGFRDIENDYNSFHHNENHMGGSSIRSLMENVLSPIITRMKEVEPHLMCTLNRQGVDYQTGSILSDVNSFITDFQTARKRIAKLPEAERLAEVESLGKNGTLIDLKSMKTPSGHSLKTQLQGLLNLNYSTSDILDEQQEEIVCILVHGTFTYISKMLFSLDLQSFLADNYYENGDMEQYNQYFNLLVSNFRDVKSSLVGSDSDESIIQGVLTVLDDIAIDKSHVEEIEKKMSDLMLIKNELEIVELPLIVDIPEKLIGKPDFEDQSIKTPLGQWVDGTNVTYAIQYSRNGLRSRLGEWMDSISVSGEANPILRIRVHPKRYDRLVFRKFNNQRPHVIGVLEDKYQTEFRDVNRDLYEAAARFDKTSIEEAEILIKNGADIDAVFEGGRRAIHAAALSDNVQFARKFLIKPDISNKNDCTNAIDSKGLTPMHVASEAGNRRFVQFLLENGGDANARTFSKLWTPLHIAADRGFASIVKTLLKSTDINVNSPDVGGFTPLHRAVSGGIPVLEVLMADNRTDLQATSEAGLTPLMLSVIEEYTDITEALLSNKAVPSNSKTNNNMTALTFASLLGNPEIVQQLLLHDNLGVNFKGINGWTPLHLAVALKNADAVNKILSINLTNVNGVTRSKITPLHIAVVTEQNGIVQDLIEHNAKIDERTISGLAPIHLALLFKNYIVFNTLVDGGADIQAKSFDGSSLLHFAIANNKFDVIESLVKKGVDINAKNMISGETPLHTATRNGYLEVIKILVQHGADVDAKNKVGQTPLHYVALLRPADSLTILNFLISNNAQVDLRDNAGRTVLHHVVVPSGDMGMTKSLIRNGANVNAEDYLGVTPLHLCAENDEYVTMTEFLLKAAYVDPSDSTGQTPLHIAVKHGQLEIVRRLLSSGASIKRADQNSQTAVHLAVVHDREAILRLMMEQAPDDVRSTIEISDDLYPNLNSPLHLAIGIGRINLFSSMFELVRSTLIKYDHYGRRIDTIKMTSLFDMAAASGNIDLFSYLLERTSYPNYDKMSSSVCLAARYGHPDFLGKILDHYDDYVQQRISKAICCAQGHEDVVELLIRYSVDINVNCTNGLTPLQNAARTGNTNVAKLLVKHTNHGDDIGSQMLLQVMVQNGQMDIAKDLIDSGAVLNETALGGITLLHIVSQSGHFSQVKHLVDGGQPVNSTTLQRETPLHFAAKGGNKDIINYLADKNADINAQDSKGRTPLHWALDAKEVEVSVVKTLIEHGGSVNHMCSRGKTPLHVAAGGHASLDVIKYLLSKNADVNARDSEGNTPLFDAIKTGSLEIVKLLTEGGTDVTILNKYGVSPLHYLTSIQNGGPPISDDPGNDLFKHVSLRAMDIYYYLKSMGVKT